MSVKHQKEEPATASQVAQLVGKLASMAGTSLAISQARIATREEWALHSSAFGTLAEGEGPMLILCINERMLNQGW